MNKYDLVKVLRHEAGPIRILIRDDSNRYYIGLYLISEDKYLVTYINEERLSLLNNNEVTIRELGFKIREFFVNLDEPFFYLSSDLNLLDEIVSFNIEDLWPKNRIKYNSPSKEGTYYLGADELPIGNRTLNIDTYGTMATGSWIVPDVED